jgi:putative tricarboxylic transport membrane protein
LSTEAGHPTAAEGGGRGSALPERIAGAVLLACAAGLALASLGIEYSFSSDPLGPTAFPLILAAILGCGAVRLLLWPRPIDDWPDRAMLARNAGLVGLCVLGAVLFVPAGFIVSMALMCTGAARLFGAGWPQAIASGVGNAVIGWLVFDLLFAIPLPPGPF